MRRSGAWEWLFRLGRPGRGCYHATRSPIDQTLSERPSLMRAPKAQVSARKRSGKRTAGDLRRVLESDGLSFTKRSSTEGVRHAANTSRARSLRFKDRGAAGKGFLPFPAAFLFLGDHG